MNWYVVFAVSINRILINCIYNKMNHQPDQILQYSNDNKEIQHQGDGISWNIKQYTMLESVDWF